MIDSHIHKDFFNALLVGDRMACSEIASNFIDEKKFSINELYEVVIKNAMYDIGEMWEFGKISVATEHLASAIVEAVLNEQYLRVISNSKLKKTVIVACIENEFHQIGIKMVADIFEMNGWNAHFLGANTPTTELIEFAKTIKPDILAISLSIYFHIPDFEKMIQAIRTEFPELFIIAGGQAFRHGGTEVLDRYKNVIYFQDLYNLDLFIKELNENG